MTEKSEKQKALMQRLGAVSEMSLTHWSPFYADDSDATDAVVLGFEHSGGMAEWARRSSVVEAQNGVVKITLASTVNSSVLEEAMTIQAFYKQHGRFPVIERARDVFARAVLTQDQREMMQALGLRVL